MKLRNKKTGKLVDINLSINMLDEDYITEYGSLEEFNEDWEDYEEPKEYWCIDWTGGVNHITLLDDSTDNYEKAKKQIGNYFETREEADRAVEKLKAWKRLKDKGFRLDAVVDSFFCLDIYMKGKPYEEIKEDLKIVFGGE